LGRVILVVALVVTLAHAFSVFVIDVIADRFTGEFEDFSAYLRAGQDVRQGINPYLAFLNAPAIPTYGGFLYPPLIAVLCVPLAWLPGHWAMAVWIWASLAAIVVGGVILCRTVLPASWPRTQLGVLAGLLYAPSSYNLWHGQMNPFIFLLLALALSAWAKGHQGRCGMLLGLAASLKVAPIVLLVLFVRRGWWRGVLVCLATAAMALAGGIAALGTEVTASWFQWVLPTLWRGTGWIINWSWTGVVDRVARHATTEVEADLLAVRVIALLLGSAGLLLAGWVVRPGTRPAPVRGAEFGIGVAAMLLAGSIAWYPHYISALIPLVAAIGLLAMPEVRRGDRRGLLIALVACVLATGFIGPRLTGIVPTPGILDLYQTSWGGVLLQLTSIGALSLAALMVYLARTTHRVEATTPAPSRTQAPATVAV
jgi:hypothetical protein